MTEGAPRAIHSCGHVVLLLAGLVLMLLAVVLWGVGRTYGGPARQAFGVFFGLIGVAAFVFVARSGKQVPSERSDPLR